MNRYQVTKQLGDGTYGSVLKAINRQTGEVVSIHVNVVALYSYVTNLTPFLLVTFTFHNRLL